MTENAKYIAKLILAKKEGVITVSETEFLEQWLASNEEFKSLVDSLEDDAYLIDKLNQYTSIEIPSVDQILSTNSKVKHIQQKTSSIKKWLPYMAASVLLLMGFFLLRYYTHQDLPMVVKENSASVVSPGTNKAKLVLSDGTVLDLSDSQDGLEITENGISYMDGQSLIGVEKEITATLEVPRGGQYQIVLADGTKVWLNAASKLVYPIKFVGDKRVVRLEGEAYFEVKHNKKQPFIVEFEDNKIEVLGTSFNVQAYPMSEKSQTTLVNGSVKISNSTNSSLLLKPNEQATISNNTMSVKKVNVEPYVLWKDGVIVLDKQDLSAIIPQLERWYNVEFDINSIPAHTSTLSGEIPRDIPFNSVLEVLMEQLKLKFEINGRRVMVKK